MNCQSGFGVRAVLLPLLIALAGCGGGGGGTEPIQQSISGATVWTFDDPANRLAPVTGTAQLAYRDPLASGWGPTLTRYARASALGLPRINGEDPVVMAFPATTPDQGYTLTHNAPANGVFVADGTVSNYTLILDVLWPDDGSATYRSLFQTDTENALGNDADMFVRIGADDKLGLGIAGRFNQYGAVAAGAWHRYAVSVQCALGSGGTGQIQKYIDGLFVGGQYTPESGSDPGCRWSLDEALHLFTDDDGETGEGYVSSILFVDRLLSPEEITALGGPRAAGAGVPGPAAPPPPAVASARVHVISHRSLGGHAPENTVAGIEKAFAAGADHIEVDVRVTADNPKELILLHDELLDRTTDGTGLSYEYTLAQLQALDAGSWFDLSYAGTQIPTLVASLTAAAGQGRLLLDVKSLDVGALIKDALDTAGVGQDAIWPSQNDSQAAAADFKANLPQAGILWGGLPEDISGDPQAPTFAELAAMGVVGFDIDYDLVTPAFLSAARDNGMFVYVFTILDPDTMLEAIAMGVDGMETDYPAVLDALMPPPLN